MRKIIMTDQLEVDDAMIAKAYRKEMTDALGPVAEIMTRAAKSGMRISFSIQTDAFSSNVPPIEIVKVL